MEVKDRVDRLPLEANSVRFAQTGPYWQRADRTFVCAAKQSSWT